METVEILKTTAKYTCGKLGEGDIFTENNSGDMMSHHDRLNLAPTIINASVGEEGMDDDEDLYDALRALSNIKR